MKKLSEEIGSRLRIARKMAGFQSAKVFTKQYNIPASTYSQYETGKRCFTAELLLQYSEFLGVNSSWLLTGEGFPHSTHLQNVTEEYALFQEMKDMENHHFPARLMQITKEKVALIDVELLREILLMISPLFSDHSIPLTHEALIEFCMDIYNSVVVTSTDKEARKTIIALSISSLKRGTLKNKKRANAN